MIRAFLRARAHGAITRLANVMRRAGLTGRWDPDASVKAVAKWKGQAAELAGRVREVTARLAGTQLALQQAREHGTAMRREVPSATVARGAFAHRIRTLAARTDARFTPEREAHLLSVSAAYRAALESTADTPDPAARRLRLDGLTWWVPGKALKGRTGPGRVGGQRFPYRGILQTREVAIGGIMLDLGANVGRMAVPRVIFGDVTAAYCAEPDPVNFACLARNVIDNGLRGLVLPDQTAIGDRDGVVRLLRTGMPGAFRVMLDAGAGTEDTVEVPCATLDTWVERLQIDLDAVTFIKVDVEGFERRVVAGARRVLDCTHIAWQMEIKLPGLRAAGDDPGALYSALQPSFTHFIDLNHRAAGRRVRPVKELADALRYIDPDGKTDVLLFSAGSGAA
jgi:FkbM family methyltransferase